MTTTTVEINSEGTEWQSLSFRGRWETLEVEHADKDGDVEFAMVDRGDRNTFTVYLNQDHIKLLIEHLQKQLK